MNTKPHSLLGYALLVGGLASCSSNAEVLALSEQHARRMNYDQAYHVVATALAENPDDPDLQAAYETRRLAYFLDLGRELVFLEQEKRGIKALEKALALDPGNLDARRLMIKARRKLARRAADLGELRRGEGSLEIALQKFHEAISYVPEYPDAIAGIQKVNEHYQKRYEKAAKHYTKGTRARGEQLFVQSWYHDGLAKAMDPSLEKARIRLEDSSRRLASDRYERAKDDEEGGFYAAALMQYHAVKKDLPDAEGIDERIKAMDDEVKAIGLSREAEMATRRGKFSKAKKLLDEAFNLCHHEKASISGLMRDLKHRRAEKAYRKAKDLQLEAQYDEALAAFKKIDEEWPQGFLDVKTRITELEDSIPMAKEAYQKGLEAEKSGDHKAAIEFYKEAMEYCPYYKQLERKVKELRTK